MIGSQCFSRSINWKIAPTVTSQARRRDRQGRSISDEFGTNSESMGTYTVQVDVGKSLKPRTVQMWGWRVLPEGLRVMTKILGRRKMDVVPVEM